MAELAARNALAVVAGEPPLTPVAAVGLTPGLRDPTPMRRERLDSAAPAATLASPMRKGA